MLSRHSLDAGLNHCEDRGWRKVWLDGDTGMVAIFSKMLRDRLVTSEWQQRLTAVDMVEISMRI